MSNSDTTKKTTTVKRIQFHHYGGPEVLQLEDFALGQPGPGQVRVRVRAAAANPLDWGIRQGRLKSMTGKTFPRGAGNDFSGIIESVGSGVTTLCIGDEVFGGAPLKTAGAFAEMVIAEERDTTKKPKNISFEEAAALPTVAATALQALLTHGKLKRGQAVFISGCLGKVGRAAIQIALVHGATVAGSCRAGSEKEARKLGVTPVVDFDFDPATLSSKFDIVFDAGGKIPPQSAKAMLKKGGIVVDAAPTSPMKFVKSALSKSYKVMITQPSKKDLVTIAHMAEQGLLKVPVARIVTLENAIPALIELEQHRTPKDGKLVIQINHSH